MPAAPRDPADPERLLAHDAFVRGLAHQLVRDPDRAEDVVQDTWLAAMRRGPSGAGEGPVRAFLATVLRRLIGRTARTERREAARRLAAARDDVVPSPAEILQREAQRAEVVRFVLALEPAQRDAVLLRFFEHLPPRAIAARLGVPVETVRTRLKRALANLRARLDERPGGRGAWVGLLAPFADGPTLPPWLPLAGKALAGGGMGMSAQKLFAVGMVAAVVAAVWVTLAPPWGPSPGAPSAHGDAAAAVTAGAGHAGDAAAAAGGAARNEALAREREAAPSPAADGTGALAVSVVFESDGAPAADVLIEVYRNDPGSRFALPRGRTDADGRVRFDGLRPGKVHAVTHRGNADWGDSLAIVAGATVEAKLTVAIGMDVRGIVVDARDRPVPGAEVLVADWGGGEGVLLARTAEDGTFAARAVATHCHIGARAAGFAASALRQFTAGKGAAVDLRIVLDTPAVEVHGVVLDPQGVAVPFAIVRAGSTEQKNHELADGGRAMGRRPELTSTDARGEFRLRHLPAGKVPIAVGAPKLAPWLQEVELVPGPPQRLVVTLAVGATLSGTITDVAGAPLRADVRVGDWDDLGYQHTRCAADGTFRFEGLAAGTIEVAAESDEHGKAAGQLSAAAGQQLVWNAQLAGGLVVSGRVVGPDDQPIAKVMVEAQLEDWRQGDDWWGFANTEDDGRFSLKNCPAGRTVRLQVRRKSTFPEVTLRGIQAGSADVIVRLPTEAWIHITGTILDPDGKVLPNVAVTPWIVGGGGGSPAETADPVTGRVQLGPYPPGTYSLRLAAAGCPSITLQREVKPDEQWDFGELRFERGGDLAIALVAPSDAMLQKVCVSVQATAADARAEDVPVTNGQGRLGSLRAGDYTLRVRAPAAVPMAVPFTIVAGRETRLDVPLRAGIAVTVSAAAPAGATGWLTIDVLGEGDTVLTTWGGGNGVREGNAEFALDPGHYRARASFGELSGTAEFDVAAGTTPAVRIELAR